MQPSKSPDVVLELRALKFPKEARLRKRIEFLQLSNAPHKTTVKGFLVVWRGNAGLTARLGITASRKIGSATVRNRVKRYLREVFRHNRVLLAAVDINVIARKDSAQMDFNEVQHELNKVFILIGTPTCSRALCSE